jgi:uncharacterized membrane protein
MDFKIILAVLLSMLPIIELRGGLPLMVLYANQHSIPLIFSFILPVLANILAIFIAFYFFDNLHAIFLKNKFYRKIFDSYIIKIQKNADKLKERYSTLGFLALTLFVAVPIPGTGAWTGCIISWLLKLDRKKSIISIAVGVAIAGILMLLGTLGFLSILS